MGWDGFALSRWLAPHSSNLKAWGVTLHCLVSSFTLPPSGCKMRPDQNSNAPPLSCIQFAQAEMMTQGIRQWRVRAVISMTPWCLGTVHTTYTPQLYSSVSVSSYHVLDTHFVLSFPDL